MGLQKLTGSTRMASVNRQEQIYFAAARLFVDKGYSGTSMSDIARAVGVTKAGLYYFVESKEKLLYTIMSYGMDRLHREVVEPALATDDPLDRLRIIVRNHVKNIGMALDVKGNSITSVVNEMIGLTGEMRTEIDARKRAYLEFVRDTLRALDAQGKLDSSVDIPVATSSILGMIAWMTHWHKPGGRLTLDQLADLITDQALRSILKS